MNWLVEALQDGLRSVDQPDLIRGAAEHCLLEDPYRSERPGRRISPTLIAEECRLARLKRHRRHDPQPGWKWRAVKQGQPSASSNMHTLRGTFAEGMAVTALRATGMEILGVSPTAAFEAEEWTETMYDIGGYRPREINWLAYPDVIFLREGQPELIQMKCPSVHAITRYKRDGSASLERRYGPQAMAEMHIGRLLGIPLRRNHIIAFAFEGTLPGSDEAKAGIELHAVCHTIEWDDAMSVFCRRVAEEILEDDMAAERGIWPDAYQGSPNWPCGYCNYPRYTRHDNFPGDHQSLWGCEEQSAWEPNSLTTGKSEIASPDPAAPSSSTMALPPAALAPPAPMAPVGSSVRLASLQTLRLPPPPPPRRT